MIPAITLESISTELELRINNPYSIGYIFVFPQQDSLLQREPIVIPVSSRDQYVTVKEMDTLDSIAFTMYGDSKYWWVLYDSNYILDPFSLTPGTVLRVPDISKLNLSTS